MPIVLGNLFLHIQFSFLLIIDDDLGSGPYKEIAPPNSYIDVKVK